MSDLIVSDDGPIRILRMNRPAKKNALTLAMYDAMAAAVEESETNGAIRCLLIAGGPGSFCAGNDIGDFMKSANEGGALSPSTLRFLYSLVRCEKPLVAAVIGVAVGVGTTMLLHCDYVVAAADARFSTPFVALGLTPEAASSLIARPGVKPVSATRANFTPLRSEFLGRWAPKNHRLDRAPRNTMRLGKDSGVIGANTEPPHNFSRSAVYSQVAGSAERTPKEEPTHVPPSCCIHHVRKHSA
jgi:hypothetical protein